MVLFYHLIGFIIMIIGSVIVDLVVNNYSEPTIPLTVISVIFAGPFEETIFFGIPFYLTGNNLVTFAGGIIWASLHILNTPTVQVSSLAYLTWLFVTPSIFASLRTWISGKGWFAIIAHSIWNLIFFVSWMHKRRISLSNSQSERLTHRYCLCFNFYCFYFAHILSISKIRK